MLATRLTLRLAAALLLTAGPALAAGDTLRVPAEFPTIQAAINAAQPGDTVLVSAGVYTGSGNKDVNFFGKQIVVRSEAGATSTLLDCQASPSQPARGFIFESGETRDCVLEGFTISNAATLDGAVSDPFNGAAVQILNSSPTIRNCRFVDNYAGCWGGAVYAGHGGSALVENCVFENNYSNDDGGGLFLWNGASVTVVNSLFLHNEARVTGGAISGFGGGKLTADRLTLVGNASPNGSAILTFDDSTLTNSIVWGNTGGDPIYSGSFIQVRYSDVEGGFTGVGNIDADPLLRNDGFHLRRSSPAINAGDPGFPALPGALDIDGQPRVVRGRLDMGADEFPWLRKSTPRSPSTLP